MIIYGGKNDYLFKRADITLGDIYLFNFRLKQWQVLEQYGFRPDARWNSAIAYDEEQDRLLIFGGSNLQGYCANSLHIFEMKNERVDLLFKKVTSC